MNYSRSVFVCELVEEIVRNLTDDKSRQAIMKGTKLYLDKLNGKIERQVATKNNWETTKAEKNEALALSEIYNMLLQSNIDQIKVNLQQYKEKIVKDMPKIKVVMFTMEFSLWPSFQSIWESLEADESCTNDLVFLPFQHKSTTHEFQMFNFNCYKENNYPVVYSDDYSIINECPDIAIYMKPYRGIPLKFYINELQKHVKFTSFVSYCLEIQGGCLDLLYRMPFFFHVWKYIAYSKFNKDMMVENGYRDGENVEILGHPKFDNTKKIVEDKAFINQEWKDRINSRTVIMWNTHFTVNDNEGVGTFFQWKDTIFEYFRDNKDVVLLWRGHPFFWEAVSNYPNVNQQALKKEIEEFEKLDNVIIDKTADYRYAFCVSDALISDAATFLVEYNSTGRPVMFTPKFGGESVCDDKYIENLYIGKSSDEIKEYIDMVKRGEDKLKEKRHLSFISEFGEPDGTVGEKIKEYLIREVTIEQTKLAKKIITEALNNE